jgi:hypothetical protein
MDFELYVLWFVRAHFSDAFDEMVLGPLVDTNQLQHHQDNVFGVPPLEALSTTRVGGFSGTSTDPTNPHVEPELYRAYAFQTNPHVEPELYQAYAFQNTSSIDSCERDISLSTSISSAMEFTRHIPADVYGTELSHQNSDVSGSYDTTGGDEEVIELFTGPTDPQNDSIAPKKPR